MDNVVETDKIPEDKELLATIVENELSATRERATKLGIKYSPNIGLETLQKKIAKWEALQNQKEAEATPPVTETVETFEQKVARVQEKAARLVRVNVSCLNPNKMKWPGEILSAGNSHIGTFKKYIPFNLTAGYHVPTILYEMLLNKKFQSFVPIKDSQGKVIQKKSVLLNEFSVTVLPPLTQDELDELKTEQAINRSID